MHSTLRLKAPRNIFRTVGPQRPINSALRLREYFTSTEVEKLISAARGGGHRHAVHVRDLRAGETDFHSNGPRGRHGHRDATLILVAYRHGLRASEVADLEWSQVEFGRAASLHLRRAKNGKPSVHPLRGDEVRARRELHRQFPDSAFVFATERGGPFTPDAINQLVKRKGERAGFAFRFTPTCCVTAAATPGPTPGHDARRIQD